MISNGLSKQLCIKRYPQLASITRTIEISNAIERLEGERDHRAFASLFRALTTFPPTYCIADPVSASSTDNYPEESVMNTLDPRDRIVCYNRNQPAPIPRFVFTNSHTQLFIKFYQCHTLTFCHVHSFVSVGFPDILI